MYVTLICTIFEHYSILDIQYCTLKDTLELNRVKTNFSDCRLALFFFFFFNFPTSFSYLHLFTLLLM
jgi:hypothetical protein